MTTYSLKIITSRGKLFDGMVKSVIVPGYDAELGVLAGHAQMLVILKKGGIKVLTDSAEKYFAIDSGVLEVTPKHDVLILGDNVLETKTLAEAKAKG